MLRYVLRNLGRRRTRTVMGVLGIFLTVAFLTAIQLGLDSVSLSYIDLVALQAGKADLVVASEDGDPMRPEGFDPVEVENKLQDNEHLRGLSRRLMGIARVRSEEAERFAYVVGIDFAREKELDLLGFTPEPKIDARTCAVSESLSRILKVEAGGKVELTGNKAEEEPELVVSTVIQRQLVVPQAVRDYVIVDLSAAREVLGMPDRVHALVGTFKDPRSYYDARDLHASVLLLKDAGEAIAADIGRDYKLQLPKAAAITAFQNVSAPLRAIFGIFALLALVITGLLIYSLISVGVEERIREFAVLRTVGAKKRTIFGLVLTESVVLCMMGVLPGVLCGLLFAKGIVKVVELAMGADSSTIVLAFSGSTFLLCLSVGVILSVGSSLIPAFSAVRRTIVDALDPLRGGQAPSRPRPEGAGNRPLLFTGIAVSSVSVIVFFILPTAFLSGDPSLIGAVVLGLLMATLLGFTLVAVGAMPVIEGLVVTCTRWFFGRSSELARRNLIRHRRRNLTTSLMFTLSISFVLFIASLVALFSRASIAMVEHSNGADLRMYSANPADSDLKKQVSAIEGVEGVSEALYLRGRTSSGVAFDVVLSDIVGMKQLWIVPYGVDRDIDDVIYRERIQYEEGGPEALTGLHRPPSANGRVHHPPIILSLSAARFLDVHVKDLVQLTFLLGSERVETWFEVEAICSSVPGFSNFRSRTANAIGSGVLISREMFRKLTQSAPKRAFQAFYMAKSSDAEKAAEVIRHDFGLRFGFSVTSTAKQKKDAEALYWATQIFFGLLLAVAVLIAVFSLIASMATTVIERRWETGVLKALGLRRKQLYRVFLGEAVVLTLSSGVAGGIIGFTLAYLFVLQATALAEMPVVFTMPYITFFATFLISIIAGTLAAYLPTRRVLKKPAAEILRVAD